MDLFGHYVSLYDLWNYISIVFMLGYLLFKINKFSMISKFSLMQKSAKRRILVSLVEILLIAGVAFVLFKILNPAFGDWFTQGNANYYGSLAAWFVVVTAFSFLFRADIFKTHDLFTPALPLQLVFAKIACFFTGCCHGFEMSDSLYVNPSSGIHEFPVQIIESIVALLLFALLLIYQKKNRLTGSLFPIYLILYSFSRFLTEFMRGDLPNIIGPFDAYQIISIISFSFGFLLYFIVYKYQSRQVTVSNKDL